MSQNVQRKIKARSPLFFSILALILLELSFVVDNDLQSCKSLAVPQTKDQVETCHFAAFLLSWLGVMCLLHEPTDG